MQRSSNNKSLRFAFLGGGFALVLLYTYFFHFEAPGDFPQNAVVRVTNGQGLTEIANQLQDQNIIQSPFWFTNFVLFLKQEHQIMVGEYTFSEPVNVYQVAQRLSGGDFKTQQLKTTIPEGSSVVDISAILKKNYPDFDTEKFIALAKSKEGYLFPDTYIFGASVTPEKVISVMTEEFDTKIRQTEIQDALKDFGRPLSDVITMASILEGEARQTRTRRLVAGILWERIRIGIPLQVDATFRYINGKATKDLTLDDLKIDSPYNTYVYKGLPPGPISSPGIDSIMAAMDPIATEYLYFLTGHDGQMYYAETLEEHVENKNNYLR